MKAARSRMVWLAPLVALALLLGGCATVPGPSRSGYQSAAAGAAVGATAGALLDGGNRWKGGVIGGALGAVLGGALSAINSPGTNPGYAQAPASYAGYTQPPAPARCHTVVEKHYRNGQLYSQTQREVCN